MRVAVFGSTHAGQLLGRSMEAAGHTVTPIEDVGTLGEYQALILAVGDSRLEQAVDLLESYVHDGLIVIHTALSRGVQVLDPLETRGCVVIAAAPMSPLRWAVTTVDELGETVASLILGEGRIEGVPLSDAERPAHAARVYYAHMMNTLALRAVEDAGLADEDLPEQLVDSVEAAEVIAAFRGIEDPGFRRAYLDAARRFGEVARREELELWALQEENR